MTRRVDQPSHPSEIQSAAGSLITFSSIDMPAGQRHDYWHQSVLRRLAPGSSRGLAKAFHARLTRIPGDGAELLDHAADSLVAERSVLRCRQDGCDDISIDFVVHGSRSFLSHAGSRQLNAGDMIVVDCAQESKIHRARHRVVSLFLPRDRVRMLCGDPAVLAGRILQTQGVPALLKSHMLFTMDQAAHLAPEQRAMAVRIGAEMALSALAGEATAKSDAGTSEMDFYQAAKFLIERECANPELTPLHVAARLGCSRAGLYRAFSAHNETISSAIWFARIERARRMLTSAGHRHLRLGEIAFLSGFREHSNFDRMFKRQQGVTPGEMREAEGISEVVRASHLEFSTARSNRHSF